MEQQPQESWNDCKNLSVMKCVSEGFTKPLQSWAFPSSVCGSDRYVACDKALGPFLIMTSRAQGERQTDKAAMEGRFTEPLFSHQGIPHII